ncbi:MAG: pilus assembly protein TadG-related protein [Caulobacteraceae bacterium]
MKYIYNKRGSSSIIMLFMVTALIALMSLSVDAGLLYLEKTRLQDTVDSAALAAASMFDKGETEILQEAYKYASLNGVAPEDLTVDISEDHRKVKVSTSKKVDLYFAKFLSISDADIKASATATAGPISSTKGIRPFAVEQQEFIYGETYTLKKGGGGGNTGNFGAVALGGTGASNYRNNLSNGFNSNPPLKIGDEIETEPGNMAGPTRDGINDIINSDTNTHSEDLSNLELNCPRLIKIPIVDSLDACGRSTVKIVGFAAFFLDDVVNRGGHTEITGRFVKIIGEGEIDESAEDYGLFGVKLVE